MNANASASVSNRRILIIDDNQAVHEDLRKVLTDRFKEEAELEKAEAELFGGDATICSIPDFEIESAYQGEEGLALAQQAAEQGRPYAAAFIDVRMPPGWDGIETAKRIWEACPDLQVVICTAFSDYSLEAILERFGRGDKFVVLKKPFDRTEALQLANSLTEKWNAARQSAQRFDDLAATIRKRTEELLAEMKKEKEISWRTRNEAQAKNEMMENFSREFRALMKSISAITDLAMASELKSEKQSCLELIKSSTGSLVALLDQSVEEELSREKHAVAGSAR